MNDKLNFEQLEQISGGQYDPDAEYIDTYALRSGNLYSTSNISKAIGSIVAGQAVQLHPDFSYMIDGVFYCIVRINGADYVTESENISMK